MSFLFQPWQNLLAALCDMVNQRQQPIIEFVNVQIDALLKKLGKKQERISAAKMKDGTSARLTAAKGRASADTDLLRTRLLLKRASNKRKHQRSAASVLLEDDRFPRHLTPRPCTCNEPAQQSPPKETQLSHPAGSTQQSRLCTSDVNPRLNFYIQASIVVSIRVFQGRLLL